ncbi:MAG: aminoglycoside phosphotransferase [Desulfobulbus propionicus]|nr:MAG: aminoglycoside phosphotransferase [Desulfobulbus propionicus]
MSDELPEDMISYFLGVREDYTLEQLHGGKVNDTWLVRSAQGERYILQKISAAVFAKPSAVMHNQRLVTAHLHSRQDSCLRFYRLICNSRGKDTRIDSKGNGWRLLSYLDNSRTLEKVDSQQQAYNLGEALAAFHRLLNNLDSGTLSDPLPHFHDTPRYLQHYREIAGSGPSGSPEERLCSQLVEQLSPVVDLFEHHKPRLSHHIIHGDPKVSNFLFSQTSEEVISLIDLDTVKPGLLLHDLGDCCRSCCNQAGEEHQQPEKIFFSAELFAALLRGYAGQANGLLKRADLELLPMAAKLISFELGLRFFTDHLEGNIYFPTSTANQNLNRALVQLHLSASIDRQSRQLQEIVSKIFF